MIGLLLLALATLQDVPQDVTVLGPGRANVQTPATLVIEPAAMFTVACDADGDARTTRAELDACVRRTFEAIDTAHTGMMGYLGYARWQAQWLGDQGALPSPFEVDRNGDNQIRVEELQAQFAKLFARYDANRDGGVTRAEALTVRATAADAKGPVGDRRVRGKGRQPHAPGERIPLPTDDTPQP